MISNGDAQNQNGIMATGSIRILEDVEVCIRWMLVYPFTSMVLSGPFDPWFPATNRRAEYLGAIQFSKEEGEACRARMPQPNREAPRARSRTRDQRRAQKMLMAEEQKLGLHATRMGKHPSRNETGSGTE